RRVSRPDHPDAERAGDRRLRQRRAGLVKMCESGAIKPDERVLLMLTGNGLKDIDSARRAVEEPVRVRPNIDEFAEAWK
ncbi:MAG TPA: hypothetical protein VLR90_13390, partial [Blastocatellia bacterium]|nr:hypothetical protein [Blastocatellia bacterium]